MIPGSVIPFLFSEPPIGQKLFNASETFTIPYGVTSINIVAVGGGGGGSADNAALDEGGAGGGLSYRNSISVTPGEQLFVVVGVGGEGGNGDGGNGEDSWVERSATSEILIKAGGGPGGVGGSSGSLAGGKGGLTLLAESGIPSDGGGDGGGSAQRIGLSVAGGGGGAGGYSGNGGKGGTYSTSTIYLPTAGQGGGGGGAAYNSSNAYGGGGVGLLGEGLSGEAGIRGTGDRADEGGRGGSGGQDGTRSGGAVYGPFCRVRWRRGSKNYLGQKQILPIKPHGRQVMDRKTVENWKRIAQALENAGKTDCMFYKRAVAILSGKPDPLG